MTDPIRVRRAQWARMARMGQRVGYVLYLVATVTFFIGLFTEFSDRLVTIIEIGLIGGSVFLAPAILVTYMVKAAERDDLEHGR
jgi:hypothetical protein